MVLYTLVLEFYLKNGEKKKEDDTFLRKKTEEKQNSAIIMISVYGKETLCPMNLKLQRSNLNKPVKKRNF